LLPIRKVQVKRVDKVDSANEFLEAVTASLKIVLELTTGLPSKVGTWWTGKYKFPFKSNSEIPKLLFLK